MNTNGNVYTVVYTAIIVVVVAAVLAFAAGSLKPMQDANIKAETLRQMMAAARIEPAEELYATANAEILNLYAENIQEAYTIGLDGRKNGELSVAADKIELVDKLKPQHKGILAGGEVTLPVYIFKSGIAVIPIYGAGLWGPVWGYIALEGDCHTIAGAFFDHESETPGLGAKIKDEAWFRDKFIGKTVAWGDAPAFHLEKNAEVTGASNAVDAITGATMTSKGLNEALNVWFGAYSKHFNKTEEE
ncbi:MAG: NADH:ubiquinone reductase (Na(+)-transporting) subunit C [Bacteroidales bacterium]|nr:NADH:ubiquinone reductase (Na(+)-transporting) subunit C [Bacteroidales bacterium]